MKALRKLLSLLIVLALFGGGITYALIPDNNIKNSEKLAKCSSLNYIRRFEWRFPF